MDSKGKVVFYKKGQELSEGIIGEAKMSLTRLPEK